MARISEFLSQYTKSATRSGYQSGVRAFLSFIYGLPPVDKISAGGDRTARLEELADRYFLEDRNYVQDLIDFSGECQTRYAPTTGTYYLSAAKEFLLYNDVELTRKQERNLKNKTARGGPISEEEDLTREMLRALMTVSGLMLQALVMIVLTSGVRIGEALNLTLKDVKINPDNQYAIITLRGRRVRTGTGTKNLYSRTTFINREAVEILNRWLEKREEYLQGKTCRVGRFASPGALNDTRIFPCSKSNAETIIQTALRKSGLLRTDEDTGRASIHYHLFRKYFVTQLTYGGVPDKYVQFFTGHLDALDRAYNKPKTEQLLEIYLRGEPHLRIYDDSAVEIAATREETREIKDKARDLQLEVLTMKSKMDDQQREMDELTRATRAILDDIQTRKGLPPLSLDAPLPQTHGSRHGLDHA